MASGSIPVVKNATLSGLTANNNAGSPLTTTGLPHNGAQFVTFVATYTTIPGSSAVTVKLQECDTVGGTYTDVTGGSLPVVASGSTGDTGVIICKTTGRLGFLRLNVVNTNATAVLLLDAKMILTGYPTEAINSAGTGVSGTNVKFVA